MWKQYAALAVFMILMYEFFRWRSRRESASAPIPVEPAFKPDVGSVMVSMLLGQLQARLRLDISDQPWSSTIQRITTNEGKTTVSLLDVNRNYFAGATLCLDLRFECTTYNPQFKPIEKVLLINFTGRNKAEANWVESNAKYVVLEPYDCEILAEIWLRTGINSKLLVKYIDHDTMQRIQKEIEQVGGWTAKGYSIT